MTSAVREDVVAAFQFALDLLEQAEQLACAAHRARPRGRSAPSRSMLVSRLTGVPFGNRPDHRLRRSRKNIGNSRWPMPSSGAQVVRHEASRHADHAVRRSCAESMPTPGPSMFSCVKSRSLRAAFRPQHLLDRAWKTRMRASTDGLGFERCRRELFCRNGAVDQRLTSEAGRVNPRPPPGSV